MQLRRQTDVPEVNSYFDEGAARQFRFSVACGIDEIDGLASQILSFVYADVGDNRIGISLVVSGSAERVSHGSNAAKIRDAVRIRIDWVKRWSLAGWAGKELMEKPVTRNYVAARERQRLDVEVWYGIDLTPQTQTAQNKTYRDGDLQIVSQFASSRETPNIRFTGQL